MLQHLASDLRYGARMLLVKPGFTLAAVLTLALGIGANTAVFSVIDALLLKPLPYADSEQLVHVYNTYPKGELLDGRHVDPGLPRPARSRRRRWPNRRSGSRAASTSTCRSRRNG